MIKVGIIIASTRPGRVGETVARWVHEVAVKQGGAEFELVDLKDVGLPHLDEPVPALMRRYSQPHTHRWAATVASFDAYVFVTPEYNRTFPGALKSAIDFVYAEWNDKSAGFVGYGTNGGVLAVEQLRNVMGALGIAAVRDQVALSLHNDFVDFTAFEPQAHQEDAVARMLDAVIAWGGALKPLRDA
ncbi:NADPH-dependent FMN reductase [Embleya sp. NPDC127516]|uniref:NADPH-dependent FMN reductase n=1 Tax=Embleya sp. NPDC127516 TaxID=3363990 RepID=UPI0037FDC294